MHGVHNFETTQGFPQAIMAYRRRDALISKLSFAGRLQSAGMP